MGKPTVYISYSHDSQDRVLALSDRLKADGIDCRIDQYLVPPPEDWAGWQTKQIKNSDFVIMICTEVYCRRVMEEERPGVGGGVKLEGKPILQDIVDNDMENTRFIPVLFEPNDAKYIPESVKSATYYCIDTEQGYMNLYNHLTYQQEGGDI